MTSQVVEQKKMGRCLHGRKRKSRRNRDASSYASALQSRCFPSMGWRCLRESVSASDACLCVRGWKGSWAVRNEAGNMTAKSSRCDAK